jgi:choline dehydrogenase-like flavoprotein
VSLEGVVGTLRADVCIVGAGAAGLTLAHALRESGLSVLVLESGPVDDPDRRNAGEAVGHPYNGLLHGRVRGLGGTTAVWPGQCMRLRPTDLAAWPFDLERYYDRAEELLGSPPGETARDPWELRGEPGPGFDPARIEPATSVFCRRRRLAGLATGNARVLTGATATRVESGHVEVRDSAGRQATIEAGAVVLAAGTIETLRLMLVSGIGGDDVGRTFEDHAFADVARVVGPPRALQETYGMRLGHGLRYSPKLLLAGANPGCMGAIVFRYSPTSALEAALRLRRALLTRKRPDPRDLVYVARGAPELAAGALRLVRGREPAPPPAGVGVLAIVEQRPNAASRLGLSAELDPLGVPRARVEWRLGEDERSAMATFVTVLDEELRRTGAGSLDVEPWLADSEDWTAHAFDSFHPAGGARIGQIVDEDLRVQGLPNVYVCGAAAFPRAGCVNPTLTIVALALRLANTLGAP